MCLSRHHWRTMGLLRLREQMKRMEETSYIEAVKEAATQIVSHGGNRPLLDLVREALVHEKGWEDVVWHLLCNDADFQSMSHCEDSGQWLLDHGRAVSKHGVPIGEAARKFLYDSRLQEYRLRDVKQWLAILSDEFSDLPREELAWIFHKPSRCPFWGVGSRLDTPMERAFCVEGPAGVLLWGLAKRQQSCNQAHHGPAAVWGDARRCLLG